MSATTNNQAKWTPLTAEVKSAFNKSVRKGRPEGGFAFDMPFDRRNAKVKIASCSDSEITRRAQRDAQTV